jgi:hypothetical protein
MVMGHARLSVERRADRMTSRELRILEALDTDSQPPERAKPLET